MTIKIHNIIILFETNRKKLLEVLAAKFSYFVCNANTSICDCKIIELHSCETKEILTNYNLYIVADTYNYYISDDNSICFESYDNSFVLSDKNNNRIYFFIDESKRPLEHTIIVKLLSHIFFYLTKYNYFNIHSSCTTIEKDLNNCVVFMGNKHSGKTTIALHMSCNGELVISDDSLLFDVSLFKAIPNVTPAKAYLNDIDKMDIDNKQLGQQLSFDDNKYQVYFFQEKIDPSILIRPKTIIIMTDDRKKDPEIKQLTSNEFYFEALKRTTINEYYREKGYLNLLQKLSELKCYLVVPSYEAKKTYQHIANELLIGGKND